jgi:hypothetical protein
MPQYVKRDLNCQNDPRQDIPEENDDSVEDFDLDEEIDSYLNQLEAIPIELSEENCGDSSDGTKGFHNVCTETSNAATRNSPELPASVSFATTEKTESAASISFVAKTVFNVLQQKREEENRPSVATGSNRHMVSGSNSEDLSSAICRQQISNTTQKTAISDKVIIKYQNSKEGTSKEELLSTYVDANRNVSLERLPGKTVVSTHVKKMKESKINSHKNKKSKQRREKKKINYSNKSASDRIADAVTVQDSQPSVPVLDGMVTDIAPISGASLRSETELSVALKREHSDNKADDKNLVSLDVIRTESDFLKARKDSFSSSSSLSGRETVILPLRDPRLPHLKQGFQLASFKTSDLDESLLLPTDTFCIVSKREPSPFPISKLTSDDEIESKDYPLLLKCDGTKSLSGCSDISSERNVGENESGSLLTLKQHRPLRKSKWKDKDLLKVSHHPRRQSHSASQSPTRRSQLKSSYCRSKHGVLQSNIIVRRSSSGTPPPYGLHNVAASELSSHELKLLTLLPPRYSSSRSLSGRPLESKISPHSFTIVQQTEELRTLADSRSDSPVKAAELNKPEDEVSGSDPLQSSKPFSPAGSRFTSVSPKRSIVDYTSLSSVSSLSSNLQGKTRSGSRRLRKTWKSQSRSPCRSRRRSISVSPWRRRQRCQRSQSRSVSPRKQRMRSRSPWRTRSRSPRRSRPRSLWRSRPRSPWRSRSRSLWRSRSRSPWRSRSRSKSPAGIKYLKSKSKTIKSRSARRHSRKRRRQSSSLSLAPPAPAEKRMRLKEHTETRLTSLVAAVNRSQTPTTAVSVPRNHHAPATTTRCTAPSAALPTQLPMQVQLVL